MYKGLSGLGWQPEWRVEGESHSLTDATWLLVLFGLSAQLAGVVQPSESIMGLFKGAWRI